MNDRFNPYNDDVSELERLDREVESMARRRKEILQGQKRQMEAKDERLVELAFELGLNKGHVAALKTKLEITEKQVVEKDEKISDLEDIESNRDNWKSRAIISENKLERLKKRKVTKKGKK